jgi:hypothetical protein
MEEKCCNCYFYLYKNKGQGLCIYGEEIAGMPGSILTVGCNDKCHYPNGGGYGKSGFEDAKGYWEKRGKR